MRPPLISRLALACCVSTASAAELAVADVLLGLRALPTEISYRTEDAGRSDRGDSRFDTALGVGARGAIAFSRAGFAGAPLLGAELSLAAMSNDAGEYATLSARGLAGYALALDERLGLAAWVYAGYGLARFTVDGRGLYDDIGMSGTLLEGGVTVQATWALSPRWLVDLELGWTLMRGDVDGDGASLEIEQQGPTALLGVIWRLDPRPPRVR